MKYIKLFILFFTILGSAHAQTYYVYCTAESEDEVSLIAFDGTTAYEAQKIKVGFKPSEIEGPHGITVSPDKKHWYLSIAHGSPYGYLYKYETETNRLVGETTLGLFPASMFISKASGLLFCVNFNLHGDMVPSSVSVVDPDLMMELKKIEVGVMPHGSRMDTQGKHQYSVGMMSGEVFEIDAITLEVSRILNLDSNTPVMTSGMSNEKMDHSKHEDMDHSTMDHDNMDHGKMNHSTDEHEGMHHSKVKPTWVQPHPTENKIYIAGNGSNEILEVDAKSWEVTHRMASGKAPYNLDITPDGKLLVVSYKGEGATGIWDLKKRKELAKIPNTRKVTHGVAISEDSKYAFLSVEGIGGEPGSVDVIDLKTLKKVASVNIGKQAGGIAFWKQE